MNERFKELRKALGLTQGGFGKILGISTSGVSDIESGRRNVTEQHLIMLSNYKKKIINIEWLRTGDGEMFVKMDKEAELMTWAGSVLGSVDDSFKKRFVKMLSELDDRDWETLEKIALKLHSKKED